MSPGWIVPDGTELARNQCEPESGLQTEVPVGRALVLFGNIVKRARSVLFVAALAIPLAEFGHTVAYGLRVSSTGAHSYFPTVLGAAGALAGGGLVTALAVLVLAKLVTGATPRRRPWSFSLLFSGLLATQLAVFIVQEGVEAHSLPGTATVAMGLLAQQPVALVATLALRWLSARVGPALEAIAFRRQPQLVAFSPPCRPAPAFADFGLQPGRPLLARGQRAPPV